MELLSLFTDIFLFFNNGSLMKNIKELGMVPWLLTRLEAVPRLHTLRDHLLKRP